MKTKFVTLTTIFSILNIFMVPESQAGAMSCLDSMKNWKRAEVDPNFIAVGKVWYYPYMSRLNLGRKSAAILNVTVDDLEEDSLYYDACIKVKTKGNYMKFTGFRGKTVSYWFEKDNATDAKWTFYRPTGNGFEGGYSVLTMTDNETYALFIDCTFDNRFSWSVITNFPFLEPETVQDIHEHLESLGGEKRYFTKIRYHCCKYA